jgi:hypothetical protein
MSVTSRAVGRQEAKRAARYLRSLCLATAFVLNSCSSGNDRGVWVTADSGLIGAVVRVDGVAAATLAAPDGLRLRVAKILTGHSPTEGVATARLSDDLLRDQHAHWVTIEGRGQAHLSHKIAGTSPTDSKTRLMVLSVGTAGQLCELRVYEDGRASNTCLDKGDPTPNPSLQRTPPG